MSEAWNYVKETCLASKSKNPIELFISITEDSRISMHGPEHHIIDGACLLVALHNAGMDFDLEAGLDEMKERGQKMPGATCGLWGMCGSTASIGAALAIVHQTGPLSNSDYYKDNLQLVSEALARIAAIGGPRCCKRNAFLSLLTAIDFVKKHYGITLDTQEVHCTYSHRNAQCIGNRCPFFTLHNEETA